MKACYKLIDGQKYGQWMVKNSQSSQNSKFAMSLQYFKKEVKAEVGFLYADYQWASSSVFKLVKVTSLQYLCSISKKKLGMEVIFGMQINVKGSTC